MSGGHYTSIIKHQENWIKYDDSSCYEVNEKSVKTSQAYLLIYRKQSSTQDDNNNYQKLLENIYFKKSDELVIGEPIKTDYGKGYLSSHFKEENVDFVKVKFKFGHVTFK